MKWFRNLVPDVEVDAEGDVALVEGVFEIGDLRALGGGGEDDEIEIGIRAGLAFDAGTVGPDGDAREVVVQELLGLVNASAPWRWISSTHDQGTGLNGTGLSKLTLEMSELRPRRSKMNLADQSAML